MSNQVCISCGLTTNTAGKLIVNTGSSVWPHTCGYTGGSPIYCGADGVLRGPAEKYNLRQIETLFDANNNGKLTAFATTGGGQTFRGSLNVVVKNPSSCLAMQLDVYSGVRHAFVRKNGGGNTSVEIGTSLTVSGSITDAAHDTGHQIWRDSNASSHIWDTNNSVVNDKYILQAGGTATFNLRNYITISAYNGDTDLTSWSGIIDISGFSLGTGQTGAT